MSSSGNESGDLLEEFLQTAEERLERITASWLTFERERSDKRSIKVILRELHTLKGEAKMMGFSQVSHLAHQIEAILAEKAGTDDLVERGDLILRALDAVRAAVKARGKPGPAGTADLLATPRFMLGEKANPPPSSPPPPPSPEPVAPPSRPLGALEETMAPADASTDEGGAMDLELASATAVTSEAEEDSGTGRIELGMKDVLPKTLRVDTDRIARVARISAESAVSQASIAHAVAGLVRLSMEALEAVQRLDRARAFGVTAPAGALGSEGSATESLRSFSARLSATSKTLRDQSHQASLRVKELDWRARQLRMVPLRGLLERHARLVRDLSRDLGKMATLTVHDAGVTIDRAVVERISDPLIHLVRNAMDHGVELPNERVLRGKSEEARLTLSADVQGAFVRIVLRDDGNGIDFEAVKRRAIDLRLIPRDAPISSEEVLAMIFKSGFSTRRVATETSGRGVGLDVVRHEIEVLGGAVHVESTAGIGTAFELRVPMTLALTRVLVLRSGTALYSIPSTSVHRILEVCSIEHVDDRRFVRTPEGPVRVVNLAQVLGVPSDGGEKAVIVRQDSSRVALLVSGFEDELEVVTQPLGPLFRQQRLVSGASILPSGRLTLLMNPGELVARALGEAPRFAAPRRPEKSAQAARVLVVEDSAITRAVVTRVLRALDYEVWEAGDGEAALALLGSDKIPDLVLTDIDMPVLGGIDLIRRMRDTPALSRLPVIVLSTRWSDEDKKNALSAGANAYLVKTEFSEKVLKSVVSTQLGSTAS